MIFSLFLFQKLIQKYEDDLDNNKNKYSICFGKEITEYEIVNYIINTNKDLYTTYNVYQVFLEVLKINIYHYLSK